MSNKWKKRNKQDDFPKDVVKWIFTNPTDVDTCLDHYVVARSMLAQAQNERMGKDLVKWNEMVVLKKKAWLMTVMAHKIASEDMSDMDELEKFVEELKNDAKGIF